MKEEIKLRMIQGALRRRMNARELREPGPIKKVRRPVLAAAMIDAGMSAKDISWHLGWDVAKVQKLIEDFQTLEH